MWGGEVAFQGKAATRDAVALIYRMLNEGYRWGGHYAAWHFWLGGEGGPAQWVANDPRAVFVRQWDWTFGSGAEGHATFGVFNDTQYPIRMTFTRRLTIDGKEVYTQDHEHVSRPARRRSSTRRSPDRRSPNAQEGDVGSGADRRRQGDLSRHQSRLGTAGRRRRSGNPAGGTGRLRSRRRRRRRGSSA